MTSTPNRNISVGNFEDVINLEALKYLFEPYVVFVYGSIVTRIKTNKRKTQSDIDLLIIIDERKKTSISILKRNYMLNMYCNITSVYLDAVWLSKSEFEKLLTNEEFRSFLGDCVPVYVGDVKWFKEILNLSKSY
jgi:predicted nucleotidyltransferase